MQNKLETLVNSKLFNNFILGVILFNAVLLGLDTRSDLHEFIHNSIGVLDEICIWIFVLELLLKLIAFRQRYFCSSWRNFDFVVVLISIMPNIGHLSVLRALRVVRVFRLISTVPAMRNVIDALVKSIPGIFATASLLSVIFYVFGVMGVKLFGADFPEWFGNLGAAMYTLFQVMTLESWSMGIARPVMISFPYAWIYFVCFILFSTFILLNFLIGIIIDSLAEIKQNQAAELNNNLPHSEARVILQKIQQQLAELEISIVNRRGA